ncbi:putative monodehydroascorbate reductase (NADH) [Helianthus annuus]|uniref:Monodehydroascorbate reductase (NADH) n=1 Tax=Helianthus annuus TaxID=4232 RepID=A0A251TC94_HELAN|nr:thioredoxin H-type [Helianthus annuus]KAF5782466.1 putative monodehydroascorbate reductase (NADH) [Helianthus annuus]KAJ0509888.1 putative monodehydroascorbate reductase (NADH) [Helianthus annuus]KAJ0871142.1 putative monodehydroascorbate reductase (NADH) [Helianthus annuus]KAJ0875595.1 putative monodehydroascorbate reductase (NADH) [Helianthus annuus]
MGLCFSSTTADEAPANHPHFTGGKVTFITNKDVWNQKLSEAKTQGKIVIANFSASWCGPCKSIAPLYIELSEKHLSLMFLTIDVDELTELSTQWDVKATPTFFFLRDGQQIDKIVGANKAELQEKLSTIVDSQVPGDQK